ncbi:MAG: molybdate ABC transporter substrate-binding protein [Nevskiaceae bacterium]|nr:MAG: molybdate ABC transporter substrate-binding protein [Nevskiaceae bacterium]
MTPHWRLVLWCLLLTWSLGARAEDAVRVFAAASLTNALNDIGMRWQRLGHPRPSLAYAASSTLAKQIDAGAPVDLFASADLSWMEYLEARDRVRPDTRSNLVGNALVLIAPKGHAFKAEMRAGYDLAAAFEGRLCTGEPGIVPVGIYARQSLDALGWLAPLSGRIVGTDDVRTALAFVERGECAAGIVYASDAAISDKVEVLGVFPSSSHKVIVYPAALLRGARPEARAFLDYLKTPEAAAVFARYGFTPPP